MIAQRLDQRQEELEATIATYGMISALFLKLPDEGLVRNLLAGTMPQGSSSDGVNEMIQYGCEQKGRDIDDILLDIARDRVRLMRGLNMQGTQPPYESVYGGSKANESIGSLNNFYGKLGYSLSSDVKEAPDQLGVEFAFARLLLVKELGALQDGTESLAEEYAQTYQDFMSQHLGRWAAKYAECMRKDAGTGFYRGLGEVIIEVMGQKAGENPPYSQ